MAKADLELRIVPIITDTTAHGPLDGRHVIVIPDGDRWPDELKERALTTISDHFIAANPDHTGPAAVIVPLIIFGNATVHGVPETGRVDYCDGCGGEGCLRCNDTGVNS